MSVEGRLAPPENTLFCETAVIKTGWSWHGDRHTDRGLEYRAQNRPLRDLTVVYDRNGLPDQWENKYSWEKGVIHTENYETGSVHHPVHQNSFQMH